MTSSKDNPAAKAKKILTGDGVSDRYEGIRYVKKYQGRRGGLKGTKQPLDEQPLNRLATQEQCWGTVSRYVKDDETGLLVNVKERCKKSARPYMRVCPQHGGNNMKAIRRANQRMAIAEALKMAHKLGLRVEGDPRTIILENLYHAYGMATALAALIQEYDTDDLRGSDERRRAQVWALQNLLGTWQERSATFASLALKSGIEERVVRLAENQALSVVQVLKAAIATAQLDPATEQRLIKAVAEQMRSLATKTVVFDHVPGSTGHENGTRPTDLVALPAIAIPGIRNVTPESE